MDIFNKLKWVAAVLLVFLLVLTTNLIDKDNFSRLKNSVVTIYEDRVVASDLIFEMAIIMQEKEMAIATSDSSYFISQREEDQQKLEQLVKRYEETKATRKEMEIFNGLKQEFQQLDEKEQLYWSSKNISEKQLLKSIDDIVHHLYDLSKVQLQEGERQMFLSNKTMESIDLFTDLEIIILVIMAILIQVIILYSPKTKKDSDSL